MRPVLTILSALAACLALAGPAAAAAPMPAHGHGLSHDATDARAVTRQQARAGGRYVPLGARLAGLTLYAHVFNYAGTGVSATVEWDVTEGSTTYYGTVATDASGNATLTDVRATTSGNGQIWAYDTPNETTMGQIGADWADGAIASFRPGLINVAATRGGPWGDFDKLRLTTWSDIGLRSHGVSGTPDSSTTPTSTLIENLLGTYQQATVTFFTDEGVEVSGGPWTVPAFATSSDTVGPVDETYAQRMTVSSPYWASGAPGSSIKVLMGNFPAGWTNAVGGWSEYPADAPYDSYGSVTSSGPGDSVLDLRVPDTATPGYWYNIDLQHTNGAGLLYLRTPFQVCTMIPSKTNVRQGTRIRVTGVVPIQGHWGTTAGVPKRVTLYQHYGKAKTPTKWNPKRKGWKKVCTMTTDGFGAYRSPKLRAVGTATLIVRYPSDDWWWGAYTSPQTVWVRR